MDLGQWLFGPQSVFGQAVGAITGATEANRIAQESADKQMRFQEAMSSSAYQRQVADMRAAGINPIYASGGSGASAPSGASITPQASNAVPLLEGMMNGAMSIVDMMSSLRKRESEIAGIETGVKLTNKEIEKRQYDIENTILQGQSTAKEIVKRDEEIENLKEERKNLRVNREATMADTARKRATQPFWDKTGQFFREALPDKFPSSAKEVKRYNDNLRSKIDAQRKRYAEKHPIELPGFVTSVLKMIGGKK